ncbi:DUF881 domain-containing protein [Tessaracoccus lubricantis]|uniref:DUF881 domain-containing protein n=1 Tax=Tessaracoccus lubricantis TaxID=545543 RepID=A0ABP9FIY0_9ACTN
MRRRPDASMSLLNDLQAEALEPEYRSTTAPRHQPGRLMVVVLLLAVLLTIAVLQTTTGTSSAAEQRQELLDRVTAARERQSALGDTASELEDEVSQLGARALGDPAERELLLLLDRVSGASAVTGPGIVVTVDDADDATSAQGMVLDGDLSRLVNGLRQAGAEAIAINGRRLSVLTPIRSAGAAITVDYVSLSPPYRVEVIGNPDTLQARFNETTAAAWWHLITQNYGLSMTITRADDDLVLPADPGMTVRHAKQK